MITCKVLLTFIKETIEHGYLYSHGILLKNPIENSNRKLIEDGMALRYQTLDFRDLRKELQYFSLTT